MKPIHLLIVMLLAGGPLALAQDEAPAEDAVANEATVPADAQPADDQADAPAAPAPRAGPTFADVSITVDQQLHQAVEQLDQLRQEIAEKKLPLSRKLNELEGRLTEAREEYQKVSRKLDNRTLELSNLRTQIKQREQEAQYLSNLLGEYIRNLESRLHITELQRHGDRLEQAKAAPENKKLSTEQVYQQQADFISLSIDRLFEALDGTRLDGTAVNETGQVKPGTFVLVGPAALFVSEDGEDIGTADQRLGSLEPNVRNFKEPAQREVAQALVAGAANGKFPFDPTQGNAHEIEKTKETFVEHVQKGGPVMVPIFALAGAALLVALYKWVALLFVRSPSRKRIGALLAAVAQRDKPGAMAEAKKVGGPAGQMLAAGVEHLEEPRELIEEIMYEKVLTTRLKLNRMLPFVAITAASAPLLGLLGTVTGIINTFKLITVFGSGDVKSLSGGISEALITTEFGLIVAIPSLLLHAFLSRKARGVVDGMEKAAVALVNQVGKTPYQPQKEAA